MPDNEVIVNQSWNSMFSFDLLGVWRHNASKHKKRISFTSSSGRHWTAVHIKQNQIIAFFVLFRSRKPTYFCQNLDEKTLYVSPISFIFFSISCSLEVLYCILKLFYSQMCRFEISANILFYLQFKIIDCT